MPKSIKQPMLWDEPHAGLILGDGGFWYDYLPMPVMKSTFKGGVSENIHRWFRLTPSFGPDLVQNAILELGAASSSHIHDPFSGAGTTAIETSLAGYSNSCIEINPFLHFVNSVCLDWTLDARKADVLLSKIISEFSRISASATLESLENLGFPVPPIHNVHRWWRSDVLLSLLCLKAAISGLPTSYKEFFRLTLAGVLVPDLTNVTLGRLQLHFIDRSKHSFDVIGAFEAHARKMISDLSEINADNLISKAILVNGSSLDKASYKSIPKIDAIITSPPYPNRYSYVWNTRPHLYMLDFISDAKQASRIDQKTIGGTWGTATSELMKGIYVPQSPVLVDCLDQAVGNIRTSDNLMANYVVHYFNRLDSHLQIVAPNLDVNARAAYVVGNSSIKGEYIATDTILAKMIEMRLDMKVLKIHRFRKRNSGTDLYESIIYASRT